MLLLLLIGAGTASPATPIGPPSEFVPLPRSTDIRPHTGVEFVPIARTVEFAPRSA